MNYIGIDLSGPANHKDTALAAVDESGTLLNLSDGLSDFDLLSLVEVFSPCHVFIDAPLSYQDGGGYRPCDKALRDYLNERGFSKLGVMAPTFNRMVYLTLRGMNLAHKLEQYPGVEMISENHPAGFIALKGADYESLCDIKKSEKARAEVLKSVQEVIDTVDVEISTDHQLMALAAAASAFNADTNEPFLQLPSSFEQSFSLIV